MTVDALGYSDEDETCEMCNPIPVMGVMPHTDPRWFGGFVDARGIRHDPVRHEDGCPIAERR